MIDTDDADDDNDDADNDDDDDDDEMREHVQRKKIFLNFSTVRISVKLRSKTIQWA